MSNWSNKAKKLTGVALLDESEEALIIRKKILELSDKYFNIAHKKKKFEPEQTFIAASSKVLDSSDLRATDRLKFRLVVNCWKK